jgi:hypothetical protein
VTIARPSNAALAKMRRPRHNRNLIFEAIGAPLRRLALNKAAHAAPGATTWRGGF